MPLFVVLLVLWMLLAGSLALSEWVVGAAVSAIVVLLVRHRSSASADQAAVIFTLPALVALLRYLWTFFVALIQANLDMARRVLSPSLPIQPVLVEIETSLQSNAARLLLANTITLTPGTLVVDLKGERLQVHWIDGSGLQGASDSEQTLQQATEEIAGRFEREIRGFMR